MTTDATPTGDAASRAAIERYIPHRPPFLYIDRVVRHDDTSLVAEKFIADDEPFIAGHYPGNPIMPGVLILECIFQAGALFLSQKLANESAIAIDTADSQIPAGVPVLTRIGGAKFKKIVRPGDTLTLEVTLTDRIANAFVMKGKANGPNGLAATVEFTCALVTA